MSRAAALLLVVAWVLAAPPVAATTAAAVADEVRGLAPDVDRAVRVDGFTLRAGLATVVLEDGVLVPSTTVAGRPVELAFVGRGRVELEPPDEVEAGQLELFTGSSRLDERFERAVFVVAFDAATDAVLSRPPAPPGPRVGEAAALSAAWLAGTERALLDVDARLFADGIGDRLASGFFCAAFEGTRLGRFLVVVDPLEDEQVTVGRFVRPELSRRHERKLRLALEAAQRRGKLIGLAVSDLGIWDTWLSASLSSGSGEPAPGTTGVEPTHYRLEATLADPDLALEASARLSLQVLVADLRTVTLELDADLEPLRAVDGRGRELEWWRSRNELVVALAEPATAGQGLEIEVEYRGRPMEQSAGGAAALRRPTGWFPHAGTIDRAPYELTVTWPEELDVVAPGAVEDLDGAPEGLKRRRWRLRQPALATSFEIGRFATAAGRAGGIAVDVAVTRSGSGTDEETAREILATVVDVLRFFEGVFGPLPLDRLQVVSSPRGFSQGLLGLVTLSTGVVVDWQEWGALLGIEDRRTVIAHEVAHQWWGNLVGWRSYRDQWISEATANYAALLWASRRLDGAADGPLLRGPTAGWQSELLRPVADGRSLESLGPLVLGARLHSSLSRDAYRAIVYKKGALVLSMLAQLLGEEAFVGILGDVAAAAAGRVISTDELLEALERLGGVDLEGFSRQFVFGTGLPEISYRCDFRELGRGRWQVVGEALQRAPLRVRHRVVTSAAGALDLQRRLEGGLGLEGSRLAVPVQVGLAGGGADGDGRTVVEGHILVSGRSSPFRLEVEGRPEVVWLDPEAEVFGRFVAADRWPRLAATLEALALEAAGDPEGARAALEAALAAPVAVVPAGWEPVLAASDPEAEGRRLDARIRLALARLDLDAGRLREAAAELAAARDLVASRDRWLLAADLLVAESRLDLLSGADRRAFRRLRDEVLGRRAVETPETWALLAVAAHAVGDTEIAVRAAALAARLGVDLGPLAEEGFRGP